MNRRIALAAAGTAALVLSTGTAAVAANLGILGHGTSEPVGELNAQTVAELSPTAAVEPVVVTVDEIVPIPVADPTPSVGSDDLDDDHDDDHFDDDSDDPVAPGPFVQPAPQPVPTTTYSDSDDDHDDDHYDDDHETEHEEEHEEVEDD
ncbi:MAG TPA: hypothetical protein VIY72_16275 [Acidimicrobiales bacterium]